MSHFLIALGCYGTGTVCGVLLSRYLRKRAAQALARVPTAPTTGTGGQAPAKPKGG